MGRACNHGRLRGEFLIDMKPSLFSLICLFTSNVDQSSSAYDGITLEVRLEGNLLRIVGMKSLSTSVTPGEEFLP